MEGLHVEDVNQEVESERVKWTCWIEVVPSARQVNSLADHVEEARIPFSVEDVA